MSGNNDTAGLPKGPSNPLPQEEFTRLASAEDSFVGKEFDIEPVEDVQPSKADESEATSSEDFGDWTPIPPLAFLKLADRLSIISARKSHIKMLWLIVLNFTVMFDLFTLIVIWFFLAHDGWTNEALFSDLLTVISIVFTIVSIVLTFFSIMFAIILEKI